MNYNARNNRLPVQLKATWAAAYAEPEVNKGLRIISYNRALLQKWFAGGLTKNATDIGYLTGYSHTDANGVAWLHAQLVNCNRMQFGWFRQADVTVTVATGRTAPVNRNTGRTRAAAIFAGIVSLLMLK